MGLFDNQFPYSNFHELNLDWVIAKLQELDQKVDNIQLTITNEIKDYVDEQINNFVTGQLADMQNEIDQLERDFAAFTAQSDYKYDQFIFTVNAQIQLMRSEIATAKSQFEDMIKGANAYTDASISNAEERIYKNLSTELAKIKVLNFFTGDYVTVQEMFDTLARLHVTAGLTYTEIAARNNTFTDVEAYKRTYIDCTIYAADIFVQK